MHMSLDIFLIIWVLSRSIIHSYLYHGFICWLDCHVHCCSAAHVLAHIYSLNLNQDEIDSAKRNLVERKKINENGRKRAIKKGILDSAGCH